jgi:hypothetical protein
MVRFGFSTICVFVTELKLAWITFVFLTFYVSDMFKQNKTIIFLYYDVENINRTRRVKKHN